MVRGPEVRLYKGVTGGAMPAAKRSSISWLGTLNFLFCEHNLDPRMFSLCVSAFTLEKPCTLPLHAAIIPLSTIIYFKTPHQSISSLQT